MKNGYIIAGLISAALLLGAVGSQYFGGLAPCKLCIYQRWPHGIAIALMIAAFFLPEQRRFILPVAALVVLVGGGIGVYHAGVEQGWWEGPNTCTSGPIGQLSLEELKAQIFAAPLVRCDEIAWSFLGLSMAAWNAIISAVAALLWFKSRD